MRKAIVLLLAFMVMMAMSVILGVFLYMKSVQLKNSANELADARAFWLAEAGVQQVAYRLKNFYWYREDPVNLNSSIGGGGYFAQVDKDGNIYTVVSTGSYASVNRGIRQSISVFIEENPLETFEYAIAMFPEEGSELDISGNLNISGNLFYDGDLQITGDAEVTDGLVFADSVTGNEQYTVAPQMPDPLPQYPEFDTSWYDNQIAAAEENPVADLAVDSNYNLGGGIIYCNNAEITGDVFGSGAIVAAGDVNIKGNISSDVIVVAKNNLSVSGNANLQSRVTLFVRGDVNLGGNITVEGTVLVPSGTAIVGGHGNPEISGLILSDTVRFAGNAQVSGSIVSRGYDGDSVSGSINVTWNETSFPTQLPSGFDEVTVVLRNDWDEVSPVI
jgi:cytoskeletal protein CcmA (bactofilin family)